MFLPAVPVSTAGVERICYSYPRPSDETLLHKAVLWGSFELLETVCLLCL